jgi:pyruvate kinase
MQKTKMVFTIGPASEGVETLRKLIEIGMSASRHNFSHGDHEEHGGRIRNIQKIREEMNKEIAIILDTKGPEIRTGVFSPNKVQVTVGSKFTIHCNEDIVGDETKCTITYGGLVNDVKPGNIILIDDGLVGLEVESVEGNLINCIVKNSGTIGTKKGVNVPGVSIKLPAITEKDTADLIFGVEIGVDIIAASFIRKASDVTAIRKILDDNGGYEVKIYSKIENQEGVDNLDEILAVSDGIMVARGDMGVEIPMEQVPLVQKMMIEKCNAAGKPVITATQMLDSMMRNPRPTRAEVSDVANAILDGTDAVMLSGETANGSYPIEAATAMSTIAKEAEKKINHEELLRKKRINHERNIQNAISLATCTTAQELDAEAIIVATQTGNSAKQISSYRPKAPIIAVTPSSSVARKLGLHWGVTAVTATKYNTTDELIEQSVAKALESGFIKKGDLVVVAAGIPVYNSGTTNMLKVHIAGEQLIKE